MTTHEQSPAPRWLPAVAVALSVAWFYAVNGYNLGWWDHVIHIPHLLRAMDPGFLPGDYLLDAAESHLSLIWPLLAPVVDLLGIPATFLAIHALCVTLMLTGSDALARALFPALPPIDRYLWIAVLVIPAQPTLASIYSMDDHLLPRGTVGILLHALALGVRGQYRRAYLLTGLLVNLHATTAAHTAVLLWVHQALDSRPGRRSSSSSPGSPSSSLLDRKELVLAPLFLIAAALPLLIYALSIGAVGHVPTPAPQAWIDIANRASPYHVESESFGLWGYIHALVHLTCALAAWTLVRGSSIPAYLLGVALLCLFGAVAWEVAHLPFARQLHPYEATRFVYYLGMVGAAVLITARRHGHISRDGTSWPRGVAFWLAVTLAGLSATAHYAMLILLRVRMAWAPIAYASCVAVTLAALIAVLVLAPRWRRQADARFTRRSVMAAAILAAMGSIGAMATSGIHLDAGGARPASPDMCHEHPMEVEHDQRCGLALMRWARDALPADARVALPPYLGHPLASWRHLTRRGVVATYKDGGESNFSHAFARAWHERMSALAGGGMPLEPGTVRAADDWFDSEVIPHQRGYRAADDARLRELARRFGATHAVVEERAHTGAISFPVVYQDAAYRVHRIQ